MSESVNILKICDCCHGHGVLVSIYPGEKPPVMCTSCNGKGYIGEWFIPIDDYKKGKIPKYILEFSEKLKKHKSEFSSSGLRIS